MADATQLHDVVTETHRFRRTVWWRNAREWAGCAFLLAWLGWTFDARTTLASRLGAGCATIAILYVAWRFYRDGRCYLQRPAASSGSAQEAQAARLLGELERQALLLQSVPYWYVLPLTIAAAALTLPGILERRPLSASVEPLLLAAAFWLPFAALLCWLNRIGARKLRERAADLAQAWSRTSKLTHD